MTWSGLTKTGTQYAHNDLPTEWTSSANSTITFTIPIEIDDYIVSDKSSLYAAFDGAKCYGHYEWKSTSTYKKEIVSASYSATSNKAIPKIVFGSSRISNFVSDGVIYSFCASWIDGFSAWNGDANPASRRKKCSKWKFLPSTRHFNT